MAKKIPHESKYQRKKRLEVEALGQQGLSPHASSIPAFPVSEGYGESDIEITPHKNKKHSHGGKEERERSQEFAHSGSFPPVRSHSNFVDLNRNKAKHFAAGLIYRILENGEVEFLLVRTTKFKGNQPGLLPQWKFPGGTDDLYPGESVEATLSREIDQEVGLSESYTKDELLRVPKGPDHTQHFFLIHNFIGTLRSDLLVEHGKSMSKEEVEKPEWMEARVVKKIIFPSHSAPFVKAMALLMQQDPKVKEEYKLVQF